MTIARQARGTRSQRGGIAAENAACTVLEQDGWTILARKDGLLAIIEVKSRKTLSEAAYALSGRQRARLIAAAEALLASQPSWGDSGERFDVVIVDSQGKIRRIIDAFRQES